MNRFRKLVTVSAILAAAMSTANANLILNGGFEEGRAWTSQDWNVGGAGASVWDGLMGATGEAPHSGRRGFFVNLDNAWYIEQSFVTQANANYVLDFWVSRPASYAPHQFVASVDGIPLLTLSNLGVFDYTNYSYLFTANDETTTLRFTFQQDASPNNSGVWTLDDVLVDASVPEPNISALLVMGAVAGYSIRFNRRC